MSSKIKTQKGDICPICRYGISGRNQWVKYHISYRPELTILACKFCNFTEWSIRNEISIPFGAVDSRKNKVIAFQAKMGYAL